MSAGVRNGAFPRSPDPFAAYQDPVAVPPRAAFELKEESSQFGVWPPMQVEGQAWTYVAVDDYDADGDPDALFLLYPSRQGPPLLRLLRNESGRRFRDVTVEAGLAPPPPRSAVRPRAAQFADLDNDGYPELILAGEGLKILRNRRGRFSDATEDFGVAGRGIRASSINSADFDGDGFLDLYLGDYYAGATTTHPAFTGNIVLSKRGGRKTLLRNVGGRRLVEASRSAALEDSGHVWSTAIADYDADGRPDIFVANDFGLDSFYRNLGGMRFDDATRRALGALRSRFSMGSDAADIDGDGRPDIYVSNMSKPGYLHGFGSLWRQMGEAGGLRFVDEGPARGVDRCGFAWGSKWADLDRDGRLDLVVVNGLRGRGDAGYYWYLYNWGHAIPQELKGFAPFRRVYRPEQAIAAGQRNCVFLNDGTRFVDVAGQVGMRDEANNRGLAVADIDSDGAPDLIITNADAPPLLYRNAPKENASWLGLRLIGRRSNRSAVGAVVRARTEKRVMTRLVQPGNGFQAQSDRRVLFGWPRGEKLLSVEIEWPGGARQDLRSWREGRYQDVAES